MRVLLVSFELRQTVRHAKLHLGIAQVDLLRVSDNQVKPAQRVHLRLPAANRLPCESVIW